MYSEGILGILVSNYRVIHQVVPKPSIQGGDQPKGPSQIDWAQLAGLSAETFLQKLEQPRPFCYFFG